MDENYWIHGQINVINYFQQDVEYIFGHSCLSANTYFISRGPGISGLQGPTRAAGVRIRGRALGAPEGPRLAPFPEKKVAAIVS